MDTTVHPDPTAAGHSYDFSVPAHPTPEQMRHILPEARDRALAAERDDTDTRAEAIQGLRDLADFLDLHPAVPLPALTLIVAYEGPAALAEWVEGLDELEIEPGHIDAHRQVVRWFAGLRVPAIARAAQLGTVREVERTVSTTELVPLTPTELVARAARDAVDDRLEPIEAAYDAQEAGR